MVSQVTSKQAFEQAVDRFRADYSIRTLRFKMDDEIGTAATLSIYKHYTSSEVTVNYCGFTGMIADASITGPDVRFDVGSIHASIIVNGQHIRIRYDAITRIEVDIEGQEVWSV